MSGSVNNVSHRKKNLHNALTASGAVRALPLLHCQPLSLELFWGTEKDKLLVKMRHGKLYLLDSSLPSLELSLEGQSSNYWEPLFKFLGILTLVGANGCIKDKRRKRN